MLLALDLGTKTGWATYDGENTLHGMQELKTDRFSGGGMRFLKFKKWLSELPTTTQIVYEEVRRHRGTDAAHVYGGLQAILTSWAEERAIPYAAVPVGTIKRYWTKKGNASKDLMLTIGQTKKGYPNVKDDNEMDAIALLHYWRDNGTFILD
jgi:hypothetical protein